MSVLSNWLRPLRSRLAASLTQRAQTWERSRPLWANWCYRLAIALLPTAARHRDYANLCVSLGLWDSAIVLYQRATDCDPDDGEAWLKLAGLLDRQHGAEFALESYLEAVRCNPTRQWFYHKKLWEVLEATEALSRLADFFQTTLDRESERMRYRDRADIQLNLGEVLTRAGQIDAASAAFRAATADRTIQHDRRFLAELHNPEGDRQPDFIIIGAPKCGTTSLFYYLLQHPNVLPSLRKEIRFWSDCPHYGLEWYLSQLPPHPKDGHWLSGESSPAYFFTAETSERIAASLPNVKLIALVRNPVDQVISRFYHAQRQGSKTRSLDAFVNDLLLDFSQNAEVPGVLTAGFYARHLRSWVNDFDRDRLLVLQSENFFTEPDRALQRTHDFLGLPHVPLNSYRAYNAGTYPATESRVRQQLADFFAPYNRELEELLDRQFGW
ncbi:MAG: sulfotransferase domain-containing protein [Geitlerinemataceae cyanobacterium]